jgi:hypothetical protein
MKDKLQVDFSDLGKQINQIFEKVTKDKEQEKIKSKLLITREQFVSLVKIIQENDTMIEDNENIISSIFDDDWFGMLKIRKTSSTLVDFVKKQVGDEDEVLEWFLYEIDSFKDEEKYIEFTKENPIKIPTRTADELYNYYIENAKR